MPRETMSNAPIPAISSPVAASAGTNRAPGRPSLTRPRFPFPRDKIMRHAAACPLLTTIATGLVLATSASAQTHRMMVVDDDGGAGPQVFHVSGPDLRSLREPDFTRDDLPIFEKRLGLDDVQEPQVGAMLDAYLHSFMDLVKTTLPPEAGFALGHEPGAGDAPFGDEAGAGGATFGEQMLEALGDEASNIEIEGDGSGSVMVAITAGGSGAWMPGGGEGDMDVTVDAEAGGGEPGVMIAFEGPDGVELTEEQVKSLQEQAAKIAEQLKEKMESGDPDAMRMMQPMGIEEQQLAFDRLNESAAELEAGKKLLRREFIESVQTTLRPEQLDRWPSLDRALTRKKTLPKGRLDGERTDLVAIAEDLGLTESPNETLAEQLHAYELTLHDALTRRNAYLDDAEQRIDEAIDGGNPEDALSVVDRATQMRVAVRSVNDQFTEALAGTLDESTADTFRTTVNKRSYPRVYRKTPGLRIFETARQLDGLHERTLLDILELERPYRTELAQANQRLVDVIRREQPLESRRDIEYMQSAMSGEMIEFGRDEDPVQEARTARREMEERYVKQLHALLTPEQVAALPPMPKVRRGPIYIEHSTAQ